jgi:4-carboxymuconolactone decarboxylase
MSAAGTGNGRARREKAQGPKAEVLQNILVDIDPHVASWTDDFVFGEVWGRPGLSHEERMLVAITALAMRGHHTLLRNYLFGALHDGISARKVHETLVMLVVYGGFPTMVEALRTWQDVREAAGRQGLDVSLEPR